MKFISLIAAAADQNREQFHKWLLREHAPRVIEHCPALKRYIVNVADTALNISDRFTSFKSPIRSGEPYDVTTEMWFDSVEEFTDLSRRYDSPGAAKQIEDALAARTARICSYLVDEAYQILNPHPPIKLGQRSPGIKQIALCLWNMPEPRAREFWREHAARALPYHIGMSKYVQNWVLRSLSPDAQPIHGIGELFWPTTEDYVEKYFSSQEGIDLVSKDVLRLAAASTVQTGEYLLKGTEELTGLNANYLNYR